MTVLAGLTSLGSLALAAAPTSALLPPTSETSAAVASGPNYIEVDRWTRKSGLPHNSVTSILQARDGYLWIGTLAGVSRFDGVWFLVFDERSGHLPENEVRALAEGSDGSLWVGTYGGGLSRLRQGRTTNYSTKQGLVDDFVNDLSVDPQGRLWIATDQGVSVFDGERFRTFDHAAGLPEAASRTLHADASGSVWVGSRTGGLSRIQNDRVLVVKAPGDTPWSSLRAIRGDGAGALFLATFDGLFRLQAGTWRKYTTADGLASDRLPSLHQDRQGTLWIGGVNALHTYRDGKLLRLPGVAENGAPVVSSDTEGGIWIAGGSALALIRKSQFTSLAPKHGLSYAFVTTVVEDRAGSIWIATGKGLNRLRGGALSIFASEHGLPEAVIGALAVDQPGHLWVGTDAGLYRSQAPLLGADPVPPPRFVRVDQQPSPPLVSRLLHAGGTVRSGWAPITRASFATRTAAFAPGPPARACRTIPCAASRTTAPAGCGWPHTAE